MNRQAAAPLRRQVLTAALGGISGGALAGCAASGSPNQRDAALDRVIPPAIQRAQVPGALVGVWQDGRAPYVKAFGLADTATGQPMTTDLTMPIGSNTKTFTVTALLILADRGKLGLDDPIDRYVKGVPNGNRITLRLLAQMRSGLYNYSDDTGKEWPLNPFRQWTPQELLAVAFRHPPLSAPDAVFFYCNTNTVLLGLVVEAASGQSLESFIDQNIAKPLGLIRTGFPPPGQLPPPYSHGYYKMPDGRVVDATNWNLSWGWAAGGMVSTLGDMRIWTRELALGKLLSPAMKQAQQQFLPAPEEGDGAKYGLALENQNGWIGHNGNTQTSMIYPYYLPDERITLVVMLNSGVNIPETWHMMQEIAPIVSPRHPWSGLPKE